MAGIKQSGFTVIELMLFLGVTGALFAALMIGVNANIAQQRYRESVADYSSLLQRQYSEVSNTRNDRDDNWKCTDGRVEQDPNNGDPRGRSSCVILGRAVQIKNNGTVVELASVLGTEPTNAQSMSDIETLAAYRPRLSDMGVTQIAMNWDSALQTMAHQPSTASFLVLRSPVSGLIRTFASTEPLPSELANIITTTAATSVVQNCVVGQSLNLPTQSVSLDARVAGSAAVTVNEVDAAC